MDQGEYLEIVSASGNATSTGDKLVFTPSVPVEIIRWGVVAASLLDVGVGAIYALDKRITAGSDTGRVDGAGGTISTGTTDVAAGTGLYNEPASPLAIVPGEQAVVELTDAADTAGTAAYAFIHYRVRPFVAPKISKLTKKAS